MGTSEYYGDVGQLYRIEFPEDYETANVLVGKRSPMDNTIIYSRIGGMESVWAPDLYSKSTNAKIENTQSPSIIDITTTRTITGWYGDCGVHVSHTEISLWKNKEGQYVGLLETKFDLVGDNIIDTKLEYGCGALPGGPGEETEILSCEIYVVPAQG